jgi:hypothetical protein
LCFDFGIELDDVTSEKEMLERMSGKEAQNASEEVIYKLDIPANRYDLLCLEGISRALRIFLGKDASPTYTLAEPAQRQKLVIQPEVASRNRPETAGWPLFLDHGRVSGTHTSPPPDLARRRQRPSVRLQWRPCCEV